MSNTSRPQPVAISDLDRLLPKSCPGLRRKRVALFDLNESLFDPLYRPPTINVRDILAREESK